MSSYLKRVRERRNRDERGAAIVEFAIAIPIFVALLLLVFDAGLGYTASRTSASAARSAARVGALAGEARNADFRVLDALRSQYGDSGAEGESGAVGTIVIYLSDPSNPNGAPPAGCLTSSITDVCNNYNASVLNSLTPETFATEIDDDGNEVCAAGAPDAAWCPLDRRGDEGSFLGVYVSSVYDTTTGLDSAAFDLEDRAVFSLYFPPLPVEIDAGGEE